MVMLEYTCLLGIAIKLDTTPCLLFDNCIGSWVTGICDTAVSFTVNIDIDPTIIS